jgi:hypothetical protein
MCGWEELSKLYLIVGHTTLTEHSYGLAHTSDRSMINILMNRELDSKTHDSLRISLNYIISSKLLQYAVENNCAKLI